MGKAHPRGADVPLASIKLFAEADRFGCSQASVSHLYMEVQTEIFVKPLKHLMRTSPATPPLEAEQWM